MSAVARLVLPLFSVGLVALYLGERTLHDTARLTVDGLGCGALLAALVLAVGRAVSQAGERRVAYSAILGGYALACVGLAGYGATAWVPALGQSKPLLQVAWPALVLLGLWPAATMEFAVASMRQTPTLELWRVRLAARSARIVVWSLVTFAAVNYAGSVWGRKVDLSYLRTTKVGSTTAAMARDLTQPVQLLLFFPPGNDVLEMARAYVDELGRQSDHITVEVLDQALDPDRARQFKLASNGALVIAAGQRNETIRLDLDAEQAQATLRNLDAQVQQKLLKVIRPQRVAYFTTGHGERDYVPLVDDKRLGLGDLKSLLDLLGFTVRRLGLAEGLGNAIPQDASMVWIVGPTAPFADAERAALHSYLRQGGRALIAMDPDHGPVDEALLAPLGVQVSRNLVGNERFLVRVQGRGESVFDLVTTRGSSHPIGRALEQAGGRMGVILLGTGALTKAADAPPDLNITFALHGMANSWEDKNSNGHFEPGGESHATIELGAAVERRPGGDPNAPPAALAWPPLPGGAPMRAVVVGDADMFGNGVLSNPGNGYFAADSARWLGGDEQTIGTTESEVDVPLVHRKDEDAVWFYGTSFGVPAAVLVAGLTFSRRAPRRRR